MGHSNLSVIGGSIAAILFIGNGCTAEAQTQPTQAAYSPPSRAATLLTTFVDWDALPVRQIPQGLLRPVFDNPAAGLATIELHITTLQPGMTLHSPHHHAWEELCLVKEGEVQVTLNGRKHRAGPGYLVFFASNDAHSIENVNDKPATYFVMNVCAPMTLATDEEPAADQPARGKLTSSVFDCKSAPKRPSATGSTALVVDSPTLTFTNLSSQITVLNSGQITRGETLDAEHALFFVKSGLIDVTTRGISCRMNGGSFAYFGPNETLTLESISSTPTIFQFIRISTAPSKSE